MALVNIKYCNSPKLFRNRKFQCLLLICLYLLFSITTLSVNISTHRSRSNLMASLKEIYGITQFEDDSPEYWDALMKPCKEMFGDVCNATLYKLEFKRLHSQLEKYVVHGNLEQMVKAAVIEVPKIAGSYGSTRLIVSIVNETVDGQQVLRLRWDTIVVDTKMADIDFLAVKEFQRAGMSFAPVLTMLVYQPLLGIHYTHQQLIDVWKSYMEKDKDYLYSPGFPVTFFNNTYIATDGILNEVGGTPTLNIYPGPATAVWFTYTTPDAYQLLCILSEPTSETMLKAILHGSSLARTASAVHMKPFPKMA